MRQTWLPPISALLLCAGALLAAAPGKADAPCAAAPNAAISVKLNRGYQSFRDATDLSERCSVVLFQSFPKQQESAVAADRGTVSFAFTEKGLVVKYDLVRRNVVPKVPFGAVDLDRDDNIAVLIRLHGSPHTIFSAAGNAAEKCSSLSQEPGYIYRHDQCKAKVDRVKLNGLRPPFVPWSGTLTISYDDLAANHIPSEFDVRIRYIRHGEDSSPVTYTSGGPDLANASQNTVAMFIITDVARQERYVSAASNLGYNPSLPPHRVAVLADLPIDPRNMLSAAFADDSGPLLTRRDSTLKGILTKSQYKNFSCTTCGSFQTDHTAAFDPVVTSADVLGLDFSDLGVDSPPFAFDAAGYPVDSGYKGLFADESLGFALLDGTTQSNGVAHDSVIRTTRSFFTDNDSLRVGLFNVVANRSIASAPGAGPFPKIVLAAARSANTEVSLGYSHTFAESRIHNKAATTSGATTLSLLGRYGTQFTGSNGNRVDLGASITVQPAFADFERPPTSLPAFAFALGYRSIGSNYLPIDGTFDPLVGLQGYYSEILYSEPTKSLSGIGAASIIVHRFANSVAAQYTKVTSTLALRLDTTEHFGLVGSATTGNITVAQTARVVSGALVSASQGGGNYLPNNSYSTSLTYKNSTYEAAAGYTSGTSQNCNLKLAAPPCFAYRQPSVTGSFFWLPVSRVFIDGVIKNQNDDASQLTPGLSQQLVSQPTTVGHIIRKAALGAYISGDKCSTLTLTTENRGGDVDSFSHSPPQPGFINTVALELQSRGSGPALLAAADRQGSLGKTPTSEFLVRVKIGLPWNAFQHEISRDCSNR
jgi:hypothetical protein